MWSCLFGVLYLSCIWSDIFLSIFNHDFVEIVSILTFRMNFVAPWPWVLDLFFSQCPKCLEISIYAIWLIYLCLSSDSSTLSLGLNSLFFPGSFLLMKLSIVFWVSFPVFQFGFSSVLFFIEFPAHILYQLPIHSPIFFVCVFSWNSFGILFFEFFENISNPFELFVKDFFLIYPHGWSILWD